MRRRVLAPLVLVLMIVAMMAFAGGLAFAQQSPSCSKGIKTAIDASKNKQGPPKEAQSGVIPPKTNPKAHPAPPFGGCQPAP